MSNPSLVALRKISRSPTIKTINGVIHVDQIETKVPSLIGDLKSSTPRDAKNLALKLILSYLVFLNTDQRQQLIACLVDLLKNDNIEVKGSAVAVLEMLIDNENIYKLVFDYNIVQPLAGMLGSSLQTKKYAYRSLYKISTFKFCLSKLDHYGVLKHAFTEIQKDPSQISSDTCVQLIANFAENAQYAADIMANALSTLVQLLKTATTPLKFISPTIAALRNLARHDDVRLGAVVQAGAVVAIAEILSRAPSLLFPRIQFDAALVLCELASTKDDKAQELLLRAGIGDLLVACLRHPSSEVKRGAILAIEKWLYSDDRATLYTIELFLALVQNGVQVSPRVRDLFTGLKPLSKPKPELNPIAALAAEIKQRPESVNDELARLRTENAKLQTQLTAQQAYSKNLETAVAKYTARSESGSSSDGVIDVSKISNLEELNKLEEKLMQQRNKVIHDMQDRLVCPVCLDKPRDCSLSPCGHTLCTTCATKILQTSAKCHVCRTNVERMGKMYL